MIRFARHRPTWMYTPPTNRNQISDFPLVPETPVYVRPPDPPPPVPATIVAWPPPPETTPEPIQPEPPSQVQQSQVGDPAPPITAEATPLETTSAKANPEANAASTVAQTVEPASAPAPAPRSKPPKKYKKRPRRRPKTPPEDPAPLVQSDACSPLDYHQRRCTVCHHPERAGLEEEFLHWHYVNNIATDYGVHPRAIYRHAHALGLFDERSRNLQFSLGHIIHRAQIVRASADSVIRAVHHYARINRSGQWVEPTTHVIFSTQPSPSPAAPPSDVIDVTPPTDEDANRHCEPIKT
jgi:hypothetical protein